MDEAWERAVEAALEGQAESSSSPRTLTLDGVVKCLHGRLPPPSLLEKFHDLEHLSIANIGVSSLEKFPRLRNLHRLILSDNRIAGGLEYLVEAGLDSLRDLDLSNNRIQYLEDLAPLARLRLVSLDLYECPVTRIKDYRSRVFGLIRSLKYLDKMDTDENERPESDDDEEDDEEDDEDEIDGEDPGSGEIDGEDRAGKAVNGSGGAGAVDVDEDEDEESDADEEETETGKGRRLANGSGSHHSNGFRVEAREADQEGVDVDDDEDDEDDDLGEGEEIDEEEDDGDDDVEEDVVEVHDVVDSDEDGVEEEDDEVDEDGLDVDVGAPRSTEGEIDGHEQGEEDDENGEIGEADEEQGVDEDRDSEEDDGEGDDEEEDLDGEFLVQPIPPREGARENEIDAACNEEDEDEVDDAEECRLSNGGISQPCSSLQPNKRRRDEDGDGDVGDDSVEGLRSSKHH